MLDIRDRQIFCYKGGERKALTKKEKKPGSIVWVYGGNDYSNRSDGRGGYLYISEKEYLEDKDYWDKEFQTIGKRYSREDRENLKKKISGKLQGFFDNAYVKGIILILIAGFVTWFFSRLGVSK